jgi:ubiquitin-activating enzyme E1 C
MYTGNDGVYTYTFEHQKKPDCPVCGTIAIKIDVDPDMILEDFLDVLKEKPDTYVYNQQDASNASVRLI